MKKTDPIWEKQIGDIRVMQFLYCCESNGSLTLMTDAEVVVSQWKLAEVNCF